MCDADLVTREFRTTDPVTVQGHRIGAAIHLASRVYGAGGRLLGVTAFEPIMTVEDGVIRAMSGRTSVRVAVLPA